MSNINYYNPLEYGSYADGITNDSYGINNSIFVSELETNNIYIYLPIGNYKIDSQILIDKPNCNVYLLGLNSTLVNNLSVTNDALIFIKNAKNVIIDGINFNFNNNNTKCFGLKIGKYADGSNVQNVKINNCDFFNYGTEDTIGINLENAPYNINGASGRNWLPSPIITNCNFYNRSLSTLSAFNYTENRYFGIGIYLGENSDNTTISNCNAYWIRIAVWSYAGANAIISSCNFLMCFPKLAGSYEYGIIHISNTGGNNGKINITNCKMNHNFGYCIYSAYRLSTYRPIKISNCHFIANFTTPIKFISTTATITRNIITDNYFDRCNEAINKIGNPYGATNTPYIHIDNHLRTQITNNNFVAGASACVKSVNLSNYTLIANNVYFGVALSSLVGANNIITPNFNI
jgi:hypothetical protein